MKSGVPYEILPEKKVCQTCKGTGIFWGIADTSKRSDRCPDCKGTGSSNMTTKCFVCDGEGRYYLWEDRDDYEGYKLASKRGECLFCKGEGHITDDDKRMPGVLAYINAMEYAEETRLLQEIKREEEKTKLVSSGLAKLTDDEIIALELTMR